MNNDGFSYENNGQFVLSYELLCLLQWLVEHNPEKIKTIVAKAIAAGLGEQIRKKDYIEENQDHELLQQSMIDFFALLENIMHEGMKEHIAQKAREKNLMPSIDQIDTAQCDTHVVESSLAKATSKLDSNPSDNPKDLLFKELLKNWKPHNKTLMN